MKDSQVTAEAIDQLYQQLNTDAESGGYHLNPDVPFTRSLLEGLLVNADRYGYQACPCRLASGEKAEDLDIICPCDYRDPDISEYGACFCGLYVNTAIKQHKQTLKPVPERRGQEMTAPKETAGGGVTIKLSQPVWRCKVCGYLCARPEAPDTCPICKVPKDRFERFI
ncbi:MAG: ferredoxin-thioredoxin reductase catalytic domain-containing protein [Dehalogenimonas sp.]|uniref:ferredoxin:thioredoxin reductase n=1 Tax=Candidatus Dehalogenimonas loeffleri TaxID=3127115 RepID=A0ABZ2J5U0_9CHLR|nr:ferredoxin-thioredoxin reductase catalytic domain-containing protein [Dehalogenimonas sp.]